MRKPKIFLSGSASNMGVAVILGSVLSEMSEVTLWDPGMFHLGRTIFESLAEVTDRSDFAIFVLSDYNRSDLSAISSQHTAKQNLIFELGYFAGRLGTSRVFVIVDGNSKDVLPSDLAGTMCMFIPSDASSNSAISSAAIAIQRAMKEIGVREDNNKSIYYSCFISHSPKDREFAAQLHSDLKEAGVQSWLDIQDINPGESWIEAIDKAIQAHDKIILVLSQASVQSRWVQFEVQQSIQLEKQRRQPVLFPVMLDDTLFEMNETKEIDYIKDRHIGDFRHWMDKSRYRREFSRLMRSLVISTSASRHH